MKVIPTIDPDVVKIDTGTAVVTTIIGLIFAGSGGLMLSTGVGFIPVQEGSDAGVLTVLGGIMTALGIMLALLRFGLTLDRRSMTALKWWGFIAPMSRTEIALPADGKITIKKEIRRSKNSSYTVYAIRLGDAAGGNLIDIDAPKDYQKSRSASEELARFLRWPVADASSGSEVVRDHDKLDESLAEKVKREGERIEIAPPPFALRSSISQTPDGLAVVFPQPGFKFTDYVQFAAPWIFFIFVGFFMLAGDGGDRSMLLVIALFCLVPMIIVFFVTVPRAMKQVTAIVGSDALNVYESTFGMKKTKSIPLREIEELEVAGPGVSTELRDMLEKANDDSGGQYAPDIPGPGIASGDPLQQTLANPKARGFLQFIAKLIPGGHIVARSDKMTILLGAGLSKGELEYIKSVMKKAIAER